MRLFSALILVCITCPFCNQLLADNDCGSSYKTDQFIRSKGDANSDTEQIHMFFDKTKLRNAHELASFDYGSDLRVPAKLAMIHAQIDISGPNVIVEGIVKQIQTAAVLGQLTEQRTEIKN